MQFSAPLADAKNYPPPTIKALPAQRHMSNGGKARAFAENAVSLRLLDHARSGLYLLAHSLECKVVWAPAYHCPALVEPFLAANVEVKFYPVLADLTPNFDFLELQAQIGESIIGVRFFGFDCGIGDLAVFCRKHSALLIEDLAHAAFFDKLVGDAAVTSLVKFYPVHEGAELLLADSWPNSNSIEHFYNKLPSSGLEKLHRLVFKVLRKLKMVSLSSPFRYFNLRSISRHIEPDDLAIINCSEGKKITANRRANYQKLADGLADSKLGIVLFKRLADNTVPYVLPFLLHDVASFDLIRQQGIQIYRWEELAATSCENSQVYRHRLVQLPVHQDLTEQQLNFIIHVLTEQRAT